MENLEDLRQKVFFETRTIFETLVKINSIDELLAKHDLLIEATDRLGFLRLLEKNEEYLKPSSSRQNDLSSVQEEVIFTNELNDINPAEPEISPIEEEVIFTNELNNIDSAEQDQDFSHNSAEDYAYSSPTSTIDVPLPVAPANEAAEDRLSQYEQRFEQAEAKRLGSTIEESPSETHHQSGQEHDAAPAHEEHSEVPAQEETAQQAERKFRLANIKGLRTTQDPETEAASVKSIETTPGSLLRDNVRTDYMEAEKRKPEFRLDLNDRVAFTKSLFGGNVDELTETIAKLNSFTNLEDAKQHLSDIYHERNWKKSDEYAQRLWSLVENKFL